MNSGCCFSGASVILDRSCHNALRKRNFLNNWSKTVPLLYREHLLLSDLLWDPASSGDKEACS